MRLRLLFLFASCVTLTTNAYAGAWTQKQGEGQVILNALYYSTKTLYNNQGNKASQAKFSKYELNPYFEYGLTDAVTIGANLSLQRTYQANNSNWGIGDSEFFVRTRLWEKDGFVLSLEPMVKLPSPEHATETPALGGRHPDAGLGLSAGYGFSAFGQNHFANLDTQYRYRFGSPENQIKLAGTVGISVTDTLMFMPQLFATLRANDPAAAAFTQSSGDDYDLLKGQISAVYKMNEQTNLQIAGFSHLDGKNVGAGEGLVLSVWQKF